MEYLNLSERPENLFVRIMMVIFGIMCLFTSGWWALYLLRNPGNEKSFWIATIFLFLFGLYQVYAGLGYARRYIKSEGDKLEVKQNALLRTRTFKKDILEKVEIRSADILIKSKDGARYRLKIGIRYPELGEKIRNMVISYAEINNINIETGGD